MNENEIDEELSQGLKPWDCLLIFGPPGSGKGTQGKFLCSAGNHYHLSSGDIFRGLSPDSAAGKIFHRYASKGHLVPDEVTVKIWYHYACGLISTNRYFPKEQFLLLDGVPRTIEQAKLLEKYINVKRIIVLETKNINGLIQRMKRRALIEKRHDDSDEKVLKTRMEVYEKETSQLLSYYPDQLISRFNADQKPLEVLRDILIELAKDLSR